MFTLRQYLLALLDSRGLTRTLGEIDVCRDAQGRPCFSAGNSAAVFRIRLGGRIRSLRCYLRPMRHLKEIYGQRLLEKELYLHTSPETGVWVDTVLGDWIEGSTLHETVAQAAALREHAVREVGVQGEEAEQITAPGPLAFPQLVLECAHQPAARFFMAAQGVRVAYGLVEGVLYHIPGPLRVVQLGVRIEKQLLKVLAVELLDQFSLFWSHGSTHFPSPQYTIFPNKIGPKKREFRPKQPKSSFLSPFPACPRYGPRLISSK